MSVFEHNHRARIYNVGQHPLKHSLEDFTYTHDSLPGVTTAQSAMDWIFTVLYPRSQDPVATPAALPAVGNTIGDYRVVTDDGDGKAAGYQWQQREGDVAAKWYKISDMDWGVTTILSQYLLKTQDLYVYRYGYDDTDDTGAVIAGVLAGQRIYGGASANTSLTLSANSGDGVGAQTGYVQTTDHFRPTSDNALDIGVSSYNFRTGRFATSVIVGTTTIAPASITDSSGSIGFDNEHLTTTGTVTAGSFVRGTLTIGAASITDSSGAISFDNENLSTTGSVTTGQLNADNLRLDGNTLSSTDVNGNINITPNGSGIVYVGTQVQASSTVFNAHSHLTFFHVDSNFGNLSSANEYSATVLRTYANPTTGSQTGMLNGAMVFAEVAGTQAVSDVRGVDSRATYSGSNTLTSLYGGYFIAENTSTGTVTNQYSLYAATPTNTGGGTVTNSYALYVNGASYQAGTQTVVGQLNADNLRLDGNTLSSTDTNGNVVLSPNGTGIVQTTGHIVPSADNSKNLGEAATRFATLYLSTGIHDGTTSISSATLQSLRDINSGVGAGYTIFWDGSKWAASLPDTEVDHGTISGLADDDHTQYALLAGRGTGQTLVGGTAASNNLTLESTSHGTKGKVLTKDTFAPNTTASYSGSWSGSDLGGSSNIFRHVYTAGEFFGLRLENRASDDTPAAQNAGRLWWNTSTGDVMADNGTTVERVSIRRFQEDVSFDGIVTTKDVTVSSGVTDARTSIWQLKNNSSDYEVMYVSIKATSASNIRITTNIPLPAGSYRLVGIE